MSKRVKSQITKDDMYMRAGDDSDRDETPIVPKRATDEVIARRPIAKFGKRFNNNKHSQPTVSITTTTPSNTIDGNQANQIKSLNANFLKSLNDAINLNPIADLNPVINKYSDYYSKVLNSAIEVKKLDVPKVAIKKTEETKPNPFAVFSSFASTPVVTPVSTPVAKVEEVKGKQPPPKPELIEVDSESEDEEPPKKEIKIQGPSFKLDKVPTSRDYSFKFGHVPKKDSDDSDSEIEIKGPTFKMDVKVQDSVFKLPKIGGAKPADKPAQGGFTFGAVKNEDKPAPAPAFSFGAPKTEEKSTTAAPAAITSFSFGGAKTDDKPDAVTTTPAFSFGASKAAEDKPVVAATPAFSFSAPKVSPAAAEPTPAASSFSFNAPATEGKSLFSFNPSSNEGTKPDSPFSFGKTTESEPAKPAFSFNAPSTASAFTFNSTVANDESAKSAFTFGSTPPTTTPQAPATFSFSVPKPQEVSTPSAVTGADEESNETQKDEVKGNFAIVKLNEKVDVQTGEEDDETLYTKRSKVSQLKEDKSGYASKGLGDLKVLKSKLNGKGRILVRSDGGLNVVLNVPISKEITYEIMGNKKNIVKIPVFTESGLQIYTCQVKTAADAEELLKNVQNCQ